MDLGIWDLGIKEFRDLGTFRDLRIQGLKDLEI